MKKLGASYIVSDSGDWNLREKDRVVVLLRGRGSDPE
jgi:hypothetical protein